MPAHEPPNQLVVRPLCYLERVAQAPGHVLLVQRHERHRLVQPPPRLPQQRLARGRLGLGGGSVDQRVDARVGEATQVEAASSPGRVPAVRQIEQGVPAVVGVGAQPSRKKLVSYPLCPSTLAKNKDRGWIASATLMPTLASMAATAWQMAASLT